MRVWQYKEKTCYLSEFCRSLIWFANLPPLLLPLTFQIKIHKFNVKDIPYLSIYVHCNFFIANVLHLVS